ncbi:MAG: alcohol dehydrogenase catalytic domain-containing protein [Chloroflexota bacterium]|nr:alcohol dehydrogenase catalytic domain-containing protein [Chloroflexota bacterium]MDE2948830.1 alcohol dehydrogenase catalytic domain-containing protein [Chloroflexota bacterium]
MAQAAYYEGNRSIRLGAGELVDPGPGEVQLKVSHCGICGTDLHIFHGAMDARVKMPLVMGHEMSATVHKLGAGVDGFALGDPVVVLPLAPCKECPACAAGHGHVCHNLNFLGIDTPGAFQSYWTVPAYTLHRMPSNLALKHGAMIEPLAVACHDVRLAEVRPGDHVAVLGGGPIGMLVALAARHAGADVIVSEINPYRVELAAKLGLEAYNPNETDLVNEVMRRTKGAGADIVFEVSGSQAGAALMTDLLRVRGLAVIVAIFAQKPQINLFRFFWRELRLQGVRVYEPQDFADAISLAASGALPLDDLITDIRPLSALRSGFDDMEKGGRVMKILLEI